MAICTIHIKCTPQQAATPQLLEALLAAEATQPVQNLTGYHITKQSIDARSKAQVWINITALAFFNEPATPLPRQTYTFQQVHTAKHTVHIIGAGPAGLFAALQCLELGIKPVIIERGKDVRSRRRDLATLSKEGIVNAESNYCFGEGGAGTYSDGKLYTRSNKRGNLQRILELFVQFGAQETILYQSHPHIGTNKLPHIIVAMRECILACGGEIKFEEKLIDLNTNEAGIQEITTTKGQYHCQHLVLATGHSARDIFELLYTKNIAIEAKDFALGVRIEHQQSVIDAIQYNAVDRGPYLPPASYSLVEQANGHGVFSFCMCPGGIIAPASTQPGEVVVNGWSPSKRNNAFSNSGMVVTVNQHEAYQFLKKQNTKNLQDNHPLNLLRFQQWVEKQCHTAGGGNSVAPAQRLVDFCTNKTSTTLPDCSYNPGLASQPIQEILPAFIAKTLQQGFQLFDKKLYNRKLHTGYYTNEAVLVATESRTSSPVRIPRNTETLEHIQVQGLYPCGEGAGYAGGIVSAAMDGERVIKAIAEKLQLI